MRLGLIFCLFCLFFIIKQMYFIKVCRYEYCKMNDTIHGHSYMNTKRYMYNQTKKFLPNRLMDLDLKKFIISIREILKFENYFLFLSWKVEVCILILLFPVGIETDTEETPPSKKSKKEKRSMEESFNYSIQII